MSDHAESETSHDEPHQEPHDAVSPTSDAVLSDGPPFDAPPTDLPSPNASSPTAAPADLPSSKSPLSRLLRQSAFRITRRLDVARPRQFRTEVQSLLEKLTAALQVKAIHLFETGRGGSRIETAILRHASDGTRGRPSSDVRFPVKILPDAIQTCLAADNIVSLPAGSHSGRVISEIIKDANATSYMLCPLYRGRRFRGLLGIARTADNTWSAPELELIRLNGTLLLGHVIRFRKDRKRRRRLRQWRKVANQSCDFAVTIGERHDVLRTTPFGDPSVAGQLEGLRLIDFVTRPFQRDLRDLIDSSIAEQQPRSCDVQVSFGHGKPAWHHVHIEPAEAENAAIATLYFTDNAPDKLLQEEVRELTESLTKAARLSLLGQMSTEFSHQLNQPLQVILTYCNTTQKRLSRGTATSETTLEALEHIESSVTHAVEITQRIRDFVKFRSLRKEAVSLAELIHHAVMMVLPTARDRNVDLVAPAEVPDLIVQVDRPQTAQVLVNLMVNAVEACCDSGLQRSRVEVFVREEPSRHSVNVCVKDNGPGLPQDPSQVFEKFYSSKQDGLGLGLAISRDICESQGGGLRAFNNKSAAGCTFVARLPLLGATGHDTTELEIITDGHLEE